jgi:hypothetical protein
MSYRGFQAKTKTSFVCSFIRATWLSGNGGGGTSRRSWAEEEAELRPSVSEVMGGEERRKGGKEGRREGRRNTL